MYKFSSTRIVVRSTPLSLAAKNFSIGSWQILLLRNDLTPGMVNMYRMRTSLQNWIRQIYCMQSIALTLPTCDTQTKSCFRTQQHFNSGEPFPLIYTFFPGVKVQQECRFQPLCACKIALKHCNIQMILEITPLAWNPLECNMEI